MNCELPIRSARDERSGTRRCDGISLTTRPTCTNNPEQLRELEAEECENLRCCVGTAGKKGEWGTGPLGLDSGGL